MSARRTTLWRPSVVLAFAASFVPSVVPLASASASQRHSAPITASAGLELPSGRASVPVAHGRDGRLRRPNGSWNRLRTAIDGGWSSWNSVTGTLAHAIPRDLAAPGSIANPEAAVAFATDFLHEHIEALAPGAVPTDFVLVANDLQAGIRTLGFEQHHQGLPVRGGQLSFRFKADRLVLIASQAYANVGAELVTATLSQSVAPRLERAKQWLRTDGNFRPNTALRVQTASTRPTAILPIVLGAGKVTFATVTEATVSLESPAARWTVYFDALTGEPIARAQRLVFGTTQIHYNVPRRSPALGDRYDAPAVRAKALIADAELHTDVDGVLEFDGTSATATFTASGSQTRVKHAGGLEAESTTDLTDGGTAVWDARDDEVVDAQLSAYVHAQLVKDYVRPLVGDLPWLDAPTKVNVNIADTCNAYSDGDSINFFASSDDCENTARVADIVYHEFGHSLHRQSIIAGVGSFNVSLSEGIADYLASTITGDSGLGRGMFHNDAPIRDFDPLGDEFRWPEDRGEVHDEGRIIGGALWDLRKRMIAKLGEDAGIHYTDNLWYQTIRRAADIPSMYIEALVVDDDDGDLSNGTPNGCAINDAFGAHGLFSAGPGAELVSVSEAGGTGGGHRVELLLDVPSFPDCPVEASPTLIWRVRGSQHPGGALPMQANSGAWSAVIPPVPAGSVVQYQVYLGYSVDPDQRLPHNSVDPYFEFYVGEVVPLYCTGFEGDEGDWVLGSSWSIESPAGSVSTFDPQTPYEGAQVLHMPGSYAAGESSVARSPQIDTRGYEHVRLQYWRWLTVEDGFYDSATIRANGKKLWGNFASSDERSATFHHVDAQWRFQDVDISEAIIDGKVDVAFQLASDAGLQLGGWTIDELCVVGVEASSASSLCGDGALDEGEECDDGNQTAGDGCDEICSLESSGEEDTDTTSDSSSTGDAPEASGDEQGCGCTSGSSRSPGGMLWLLLPFLANLRRHRHRLAGRAVMRSEFVSRSRQR